jgi:predicted nucleic acid-binding protein
LDAFDADVLIYAAVPGHPLGRRVSALFPVKAPGKTSRRGGVGSVLLLPEVMTKPLRDGDSTAVQALGRLLSRLDLRPVDRAIAELATVVGARYRLRDADATHLATAISLGAERFITNNRRDFPESIREIDVTYPDMLPER